MFGGLGFQHGAEKLNGNIFRQQTAEQILRGLLSGVTRYTDLKEGVAPISDALLSDRLKELESLGIVRREVTPSTPVRITYGLTVKGEDLAGVIGELAEWAERWAEEPAIR